MWKRIVPDEPLDLDAIEREVAMLLDRPHVHSRVVPEILAGHARSLIARVREQEQEIAELREKASDHDATVAVLSEAAGGCFSPIHIAVRELLRRYDAVRDLPTFEAVEVAVNAAVDADNIAHPNEYRDDVWTALDAIRKLYVRKAQP